MTGSTAAVLASRTRQRREARIRENYERIFASIINPDSAKFAARHPTRVIPDVPGIFGLSKTEIKKDTKEIDKNNNFMVRLLQVSSRTCEVTRAMTQHTPDFQDEEEMLKRVQTSMRPSIPPDSTLVKKKQRLLDWSKSDDSTVVQQELERLKSKVQSSKTKLSALESQHSQIEDVLELSRKYLTEMYSMLQSQSHALREQIKGAIEKVIEECQVTLPSQYNPFAIDWATIVQELCSRLLQQRQLQKELSSLVQQHLSSSVSSKNQIATQVTVDLSDLETLPGFSASLVSQEEEHGQVKIKEEKGTEKGAEEEEEDEKDQLIGLFTSLQMNMTRDEELLEDLELFLQDFNPSSSSSSSAVKSDSRDLLSSSCLFWLETMAANNEELLSSETVLSSDSETPGVLVVKAEPASSDEKKEKITASPSTAFAALLEERQQRLKTLLNHHYQAVLNQLEPASSSSSSSSSAAGPAGGLMTRKKRIPAALSSSGANKTSPDTVQARTSVRSRVERGVPLLFSPLSLYEDSYLGTASIQTIFSRWKNGEYLMHSVLPASIQRLEEDLLESLSVQASIAVSCFQQKRLQASQEELEKLIQEAQASLAKSENYYKQVLVEDYHERNRMKQALVTFGLLESSAMASGEGNNNAQQDVFDGMDGLEALSQMITSSSAASDPLPSSSGNNNNNHNNTVPAAPPSREAARSPVNTSTTTGKQRRGTYPRMKASLSNSDALSLSQATNEESEAAAETSPPPSEPSKPNNKRKQSSTSQSNLSQEDTATASSTSNKRRKGDK